MSRSFDVDLANQAAVSVVIILIGGGWGDREKVVCINRLHWFTFYISGLEGRDKAPCITLL